MQSKKSARNKSLFEQNHTLEEVSAIRGRPGIVPRWYVTSGHPVALADAPLDDVVAGPGHCEDAGIPKRPGIVEDSWHGGG